MINKICSRCGRILPVGERCSCQPAYRRDYNKFRRDQKIKEFRASSAWKAMRKYILERDDNTDQYVLYTTGELRPGFSVHHILPLSTKEGWDKRLSPDNLITLSDDTHSSIEYRYKTKFKEQLQQELFDIVNMSLTQHENGEDDD